MTTYQLVRRFTIAFLLAVIFAAVLFISKAHAQDDGGEILAPKPKSFCDTLEPYGYWWFFWGCNLHYHVSFTVIRTPLPVVVPVVTGKK